MLGLSDEVKEHASFMQRCHMHTNHCSDNSTCTMSYDQTCPLPQVFFVNEGGGVQRPIPSSNLVPCWSFPQPRERTRSQQRNRGCMGVSSGAALVVLMLFLLVFATLGFEAYQIQNLQKKLKAMQEVSLVSKLSSPEKQIGVDEASEFEKWGGPKPAAHVMGLLSTQKFSETLRWDPHLVPAYTTGGITYRAEDGALQVNEHGRYHVYSRVEFIIKDCSPFSHTMFVRRDSEPLPEVLMKGHREGLCFLRTGHSWTTESYLGSAIELQKNDRVYVNVSHPRQLTHAPYTNFFGLYKI